MWLAIQRQNYPKYLFTHFNFQTYIVRVGVCQFLASYIVSYDDFRTIFGTQFRNGGAPNQFSRNIPNSAECQ